MHTSCTLLNFFAHLKVSLVPPKFNAVAATVFKIQGFIPRATIYDKWEIPGVSDSFFLCFFYQHWVPIDDVHVCVHVIKITMICQVSLSPASTAICMSKNRHVKSQKACYTSKRMTVHDQWRIFLAFVFACVSMMVQSSKTRRVPRGAPCWWHHFLEARRSGISLNICGSYTKLAHWPISTNFNMFQKMQFAMPAQSYLKGPSPNLDVWPCLAWPGRPSSRALDFVGKLLNWSIFHASVPLMHNNVCQISLSNAKSTWVNKKLNS